MSPGAAVVVERPRLTDEQERAVGGILGKLKNGAKETSLAGFAGVGKSYTTAVLLERLNTRVAVCALTGKAAEVLRRKGVEQAQTIHSLIFLPFEDPDTGRIKYRLRDSIDCALIVVDEASMVGEYLYRDLKSFGKPIIWVGDHGQLEPVAGGKFNLMADPEFRLETIHRNAGDIAEFAQWIRQGNDPERWPKRGRSAQVEFRARNTLKRQDLAEADQVLCAFHRTRVSLNQQIRTHLGIEGGPRVGERVICGRNNRELAIFNGMQGTIAGLREERGKRLLDFEVDGQVVAGIWYEPEAFGREKAENNAKLDVPTPIPFEWSYAITVHRSQGSEWEHVVVIDQKCAAWSCEKWRYTAATRARKKLTWVS